ncbi:YfiT family bacillithiol transferase [Daejeonella sp.]|uniref:YfiT family bacillithiol transferase n=1 Tax=Daejeonella sp. TaxID=2805397 RepID=UPI0030C4953D
MEDNIEQLKYPIGKFKYTPGSEELSTAIERINSLPDRLRSAVAGLTDIQLDTPYRNGGWTLRQVTHHIPDSHINAYVRFKLAMTEANPDIRPYDEVKWAECEEAKHGEVQLSLDLLEALHKRWVTFLRSLNAEDLDRTYYHPVNKKQSKLMEVVFMYAWHGDHHLAHITNAKERNKW